MGTTNERIIIIKILDLNHQSGYMSTKDTRIVQNKFSFR
jgi:hypothetical protein